MCFVQRNKGSAEEQLRGRGKSRRMDILQRAGAGQNEGRMSQAKYWREEAGVTGPSGARRVWREGRELNRETGKEGGCELKGSLRRLTFQVTFEVCVLVPSGAAQCIMSYDII